MCQVYGINIYHVNQLISQKCIAAAEKQEERDKFDKFDLFDKFDVFKSKDNYKPIGSRLANCLSLLLQTFTHFQQIC